MYVLLVGTFPFNSVLAGMLSSLGFLTLTGAPLPNPRPCVRLARLLARRPPVSSPQALMCLSHDTIAEASGVRRHCERMRVLCTGSELAGSKCMRPCCYFKLAITQRMGCGAAETHGLSWRQ